jgi:predicted GIY-YIG superfamily endonuclease
MGLYAVYRFRNSNGDLLYVGATSRLTLRLKEHRHYQSWWHEVDLTDITTEWFYTVEEAAAREHELIQLDMPRYNSRQVGKYRLNTERQKPAPTDTSPDLVARVPANPYDNVTDDTIDEELTRRMASGE